MKDIQIKEVDLLTAPDNEKLVVELRNERYFISYENSDKRVSILFKDLSWLKKHYGIEKDKSIIITKDSLNEGRRNEIAMFERALRHNCPLWELNKVDAKTDKVKINPDTEKPYHLTKLDESGKKRFKENINQGLFVLCKYV